MHMSDDELLQFNHVRVMRSTGAALLCAIGDKIVWLPRNHISGSLWCAGDRGKLLIRRWIARDRCLIDPCSAGPASSLAHSASHQQPCRLHLVRTDSGEIRAN
jgi:hypothetical protein